MDTLFHVLISLREKYLSKTLPVAKLDKSTAVTLLKTSTYTKWVLYF